MSPELYRLTQEAQQLKGLSERTQESYLRSVRQLFDFAQCEPEALTEAQLRGYYLHRRNVSRWHRTRCALAISPSSSSLLMS